MPYYPSSQVLPNLYTNGGEYALITTGEVYKGYYHEISNGTSFTQKTPQKNSVTLVPLNPATQKPITNLNPSITGETIQILGRRYSTTDSPIIINPKTNSPYLVPDSSYNSNDIPRAIPVISVSYPTKEDTNKGIYTRYFVKKNNEIRYFEINKLTYNLLLENSPQIATDLYSGASLQWKITGDKEKVFIYNRNQTRNIERKLRWPGFSQYFKEKFNQFFQSPKTQENLYTNGSEFKTSNGKEYVGPYHIHPEKGSMVGAFHSKFRHDLLYPITPSLLPIETLPLTSQPQSSIPSTPPSPSTGGYSSDGGGY
tara:strand:- start:6 stop:941 length:936 start_codon:yes stop_codon:yes gene_type:complete